MRNTAKTSPEIQVEQNTPASESIQSAQILKKDQPLITIQWRLFDFSEYGLAHDDVLNQVGVHCSSEKEEPVLIGIRASSHYAMWATLHEYLCQRGGLVKWCPYLANHPTAANNHPEHCQLVESIIKNLMENARGRSRGYDFEDYRQDRIKMFRRVLKMQQSPELDAMMSTTLEWLEGL